MKLADLPPKIVSPITGKELELAYDPIEAVGNFWPGDSPSFISDVADYSDGNEHIYIAIETEERSEEEE